MDRVGARGGDDPDGDGVKDEINEGQLSALTLFVAMQEVPVVSFPAFVDGILPYGDPGPEREKGRILFGSAGCASCHVPTLPLKSTIFSLESRTGGEPIKVDLARDAAEPRIAPGADGGADVPLYSDLKRHDMGPDLAERKPDRGVAPQLFLTRPLWGIARSRPYLHDARAPTLEDAILAHGGEAQASRDAFDALNITERGSLLVFLTTLTRARRFSQR